MLANEGMMPTCTKENPAPKGEPIYPGAVAAHVAWPDWEHPDIIVGYSVTSGDVFYDPGIADNAFQPVEHRHCKHCGGNIGQTEFDLKRSPLKR